ncbi:alpha/beta hydrolase [Solimonas marina]|uniref:Carboxylesterase n=1 Tax=Solimonas marina TaxID=2714601 RepID=A0A970B4W1_9GAMM|nr:carboxylesterase [Solimonas marina]NKF21053.1 carboxylesterase [Solimonas marina]
MNAERTDSEIILEPDVPARAAVVWLHGLGADGNDFIPIVPELDLPRDAGVRFVFPHAPVRPVTLNAGMPMRAWYDLYDLDKDGPEDETGIRTSAARIRGYLEAQLAAGIAAERLVLAGFSQGGAMTLHTGLRLPQAIGGLIALSAYLPLHQSFDAEASDAARKIPLLIAHGRHDPIVPCTWGEAAAEGLGERGYDVRWHRYAMAHEVCEEEIADIGKFLRQRLL